MTSLRTHVLGGTDEQYLYVGHGADCVLLCDRDTPKWRNGIGLTPAAARKLAADLIQQADAAEDEGAGDVSERAKLDCQCCGSRDVTDSHVLRCRRNYAARTEAEAHGAAQAIPDVTTSDLWAHLGHVASPEDATRIVRQVVDLGWRPVVGSDPRRLWNRDEEAGDA